MMTNSSVKMKQFPAEWDKRVNTVIIAYPSPKTDWCYMLEEARNCFDTIINTLATECKIRTIVIADYSTVRARFGSKGFFNNNIRVFDIDYNDTWARDFAPITVIDSTTDTPIYLDFCFNGWGMKFAANEDNCICRNLNNAGFLNNSLKNNLDFVLEGGSVESDGNGTLLTTEKCLLSPNRNPSLSKIEIEARLKNELGVQRVLWLKNGALEGDDTDSHIDTLARFVASDSIAYVKCNNVMDTHFTELNNMEKELKELRQPNGEPYNLIPLPFPTPIYDDEGRRLPATYANFLILPEHVLLPVYNQPENDKSALSVLKKIYPEKEIIPIDCNALIKQHGSLHCITMQMIL